MTQHLAKPVHQLFCEPFSLKFLADIGICGRMWDKFWRNVLKTPTRSDYNFWKNGRNQIILNSMISSMTFIWSSNEACLSKPEPILQPFYFATVANFWFFFWPFIYTLWPVVFQVCAYYNQAWYLQNPIYKNLKWLRF